MGKVNLDALIPREDFEITEKNEDEDATSKITGIKLSDLERKDNFFYPFLRKPDFQRETNEWDSKKVLGLVQSFMNGDLIPAVILWKTKGSYTFTIDGAHRLGALIAWVNDDYGDGQISREFFEIISDEQQKMAQKTRKLFESTIGSYESYKKVVETPKGIEDKIVKRASGLGTTSIQVQWVRGDSKKAEESFFRINQQASKIDDTELKLLKARNKSNGIVARAIKNNGMGHKYWSKFNDQKQDEIEKIAKEIYGLIFIPPLKKPIKSIELLPIAGKSGSAQALQLVLQFVNICNGIVEKRDKNKKDRGKEDLDDKDGTTTLDYLRKCRDTASRINSIKSFSLGLHPAVYLYSKEGNYKYVSFYAIVDLAIELSKNKSLLDTFISVREPLEDLLLDYDYFIQQIVRKYRSGYKSYPYIKEFYIELIKKLSEGKTKDKVIEEILKEKFDYLTIQTEETKKDKISKEFSTPIKSAIYITECLKNALRCNICKARIDERPRTIDHIQRQREGGSGTIDNGQIAHPYCNTGYKN